MKKSILFLLTLCFTITTYSQNLIGAWESFALGKEGVMMKNVVIFADGYQVSTWYDAKTGKFISTNGGKWKREGNTVTETVEFDTQKPERIGTDVTFDISLNGNILNIVGKDNDWKRIDKGRPGKLQGAWLMSGRVRDGKTQNRNTDRPRKTMKILSGTRFQWIAYNVATKEFKGTGGGTYTTVEGKYTENIEFFSRDNSRVGASLQFDYDFVDGAWHHKGFSSKGAAMHEIWSVRK